MFMFIYIYYNEKNNNFLIINNKNIKKCLMCILYIIVKMLFLLYAL